ncbi:MAG: hypothetical protein AABY22_25065, partial [Nanoarchaeota archaeon]
SPALKKKRHQLIVKNHNYQSATDTIQKQAINKIHTRNWYMAGMSQGKRFNHGQIGTLFNISRERVAQLVGRQKENPAS